MMRMPCVLCLAVVLWAPMAHAHRQLVCHFNGEAPQAEVNDFAGPSAAVSGNGRLSPPGTGFPGDGPQGRALDTGYDMREALTLNLPLSRESDFSQGTMECWVKTAWDWVEREQHSFLFLKMEGGVWNSICLYYHGRMGDAQMYAFNIFDVVDHPIVYDGHKLNWKKDEWHHIAACWTQHSTWMFADGKLVAHRTWEEPIRFSPPTGGLEIGRPGLYGAACGALVDEVRVCDEPLYIGQESFPLPTTALLPDKLPARLSDGAEVTASSCAPLVQQAADVPELHDGVFGQSVRIGWAANAGSVQVDLPEAKRLAGVRWSRDGRRITDGEGEKGSGWARATDLPRDFTLEVSSDGQQWTPVVKQTGFYLDPFQLVGTGVRFTHSFELVAAKSVRMVVTRGLPPGLGEYPMLDEFEVLEAGTNANLARAARVSTDRSVFRREYSPAKLVDGRFGDENAWRAAQGGPAWVMLVLKEEAEVHALEFSRSAEGLHTDGTPQELAVEAEVSGQWTEIGRVKDNTKAPRQRLDLKPTKARRVRLQLPSTADGKEVTLDEVALY